MGRTIYYCASTLDGFIAESDDTLDWLLGYQGSSDVEGADRGGRGSYEGFYEGVGALVSGSVTYEFVLDHMEETGEGWPYAGKPTWVLSTRDLRVPDGDGVDVRVVDAKVPDPYDEMIAAAGDGALWVIGGGNVASQFADEGLLDEVHVTVVPVVLGDGKPLFDRRLPGGPMRLVGVWPFDSGMVELRYEIEDAERQSARD
jgi:dihydrofolate reductase